MEVVNQPYISVDINPNSVQAVFEKLSQSLDQLGISAERSHLNLHVSLAYVLGSCEKNVLAEIAKKVAEQKLEATVCGVEILEGQTTGYDYIALSFESNNDFVNCSKELSFELSTREFSGGFRAHLTLFRLKKGAIAKERAHTLCQSLSQKCDRSKVSAQAVSIFNSSYEKQLSVAI